jgi:hypothetical protein
VVVFTGRSGSTFCMSCLASHPEIHADGETIARFPKEKRSADEQLARVESYYGGSPAAGIRAFGFKTKASDVLDDDGFARLVDRRGIRLLLLTRRNVIKQAISLLRAIQLNETTGEWNLHAEEHRVSTVRIEPEELRTLADRYQQGSEGVWRYETLTGVPSLRLDYESLLAEPDATFRRIFEFLDVAPRRVEGATLKHTSDDLRHALENFDELHEYFAGSPYQDMLGEVLVGR